MAKKPRNVTEIESAGDGELVKEEARRLARLGSVDAIKYVLHVIKDDAANTHHRVRCSSMLLEAAGILQAEPKATGLFDAGTAEAANGRARAGT